MGLHCGYFSGACTDRATAPGSTHYRRCGPLDCENRFAMARPAGGISAMGNRVGFVRQMECRRHAGRNPLPSASHASRRGRYRRGFMVRRWHTRPSRPLCWGRWEKNDPEEPADHALGRSRGGFSTKIHLLCDGKGHPLHFHHITPADYKSLLQPDGAKSEPKSKAEPMSGKQ